MAAGFETPPDVLRRKRRVWVWIIAGGLLACLLLVAGVILYVWNPSPSSRPVLWEPKSSTSGMRLDLIEVGRQATPRGTELSYIVRTVGMPTDRTYTGWFKIFDEDAATSWGDYRVDSSGQLLVAATGKPAGVFKLGNYARGQPLKIALMTSDGSIKVFAKVVPFPIEVTNGQGCRLTVELASADGETFQIRGEGFAPQEPLTNYDRSEDELMTLSQTADAQGRVTIISFPAVTGKQSGTASQRLVGKSCDLTVEYQWGPAALEIQ